MNKSCGYTFLCDSLLISRRLSMESFINTHKWADRILLKEQKKTIKRQTNIEHKTWYYIFKAHQVKMSPNRTKKR